MRRHERNLQRSEVGLKVDRHDVGVVQDYEAGSAERSTGSGVRRRLARATRRRGSVDR